MIGSNHQAKLGITNILYHLVFHLCLMFQLFHLFVLSLKYYSSETLLYT